MEMTLCLRVLRAVGAGVGAGVGLTTTVGWLWTHSVRPGDTLKGKSEENHTKSSETVTTPSHCDCKRGQCQVKGKDSYRQMSF